MKHLFSAITCNEPGRLIAPAVWNAFANLSNLFPFLCLASIVRQIYDYFVTGVLNPAALWKNWGIMVLFFILTYVLENVACKYTYRDGFIASAAGRVKLAEHIRKLPLGVLMGKGTGEIGSTMMHDFSRTEAAMTHILPQIIAGVIIAVLAPVLMLISDWRMGLAAFCGFPAALIMMLGMKGLEHRLDERLSKAKAEQAGRLQEYLYGMQVIKSCSMQGGNFGKLEKSCRDYRDAYIKVEGSIGPLNLIAGALLRSGLSIMTVTGVFLAAGGSLSVSSFALFLLVGARIFDPLAVALMNHSELMRCAMAGERIVSLLKEPEMQGSKAAPDSFEISFDHVGFDYGNGEVLHDVSARFRPGTMTALVGPSGSGKSTMLRLAARFYDPRSGKVLMGGEWGKEIEPGQFMEKISMVFQDVYLFRDTIENNIRYGRENATGEEIRQAARLANCCGFIMQQPQGFDTMVGEGGSTLSGGEKQRISIARAMLKNAPVVLLDEATASLDPENEGEIQEAISHLIKGRTVIVAAHRLKTVMGANNIIVLENGCIVEEGTHEQLLGKRGLYAKLWKLQTVTEVHREP